MVRMIALKTFRVSGGDMVSPGKEFDVNEGRARDYEDRGMARRATAKSQAKPTRSRQTTKAETTGPLASAGGRTGAAKPSSSSPRARAAKTRQPRSAKAAPAS